MDRPAPRRWRRRAGIALLLLGLTAALGVALLHWLLPGAILARQARATADMGAGHRGSAERVTLSLLAPGYRLHGVEVVQQRSPARTLARVGEVQVRLHPLRGRSEVRLQGLELDLDADPATARLGAGVDWRRFLEALAPGLPVHSVAIDDARLQLRLPGLRAHPIQVDQLQLRLLDLDLVSTDARPAPARIEGKARLMAHAPLSIQGVFDPHQRMQRVNLRLGFDALDLTRLDPYARYWRGIDFERGHARGTLRLASHGERLRGGLQAELHDVDVFDARQDLGRDGDGLLRAARELLAGGSVALSAGPMQVEQALDRRIALPDDNFAGLRAMLEGGLAALPER